MYSLVKSWTDALEEARVALSGPTGFGIRCLNRYWLVSYCCKGCHEAQMGNLTVWSKTRNILFVSVKTKLQPNLYNLQ